MILGRLETRNYEWLTLTHTPAEAIENLRNAWNNHSQDGDLTYYKWQDLEDSVTLTPISLGDIITDCLVCENWAQHK